MSPRKFFRKVSDQSDPFKADALKPGDSDTQAADTDSKRPYEFFTIAPQAKHSATVIWLHGLGDSGHGMLTCAPIVRAIPGVEHVKWIFPHAHRMIVTGARGAFLTSWFNCFSFDVENRDEDEPGLYRAVERINDMISAEEKEYGIPSSRIIVGGNSQGSAVALLTALTTTRPLAGVFVLAGYVPLRKKTKEIASPVAPTLPIFWGHGRLDPRVKYDFSLRSARTLSSDLAVPFYGSDERLTSQHFKEPGSTAGLRFMSYDNLGHWMSSMEMEDMHAWISALLPKVAVEEHSQEVESAT